MLGGACDVVEGAHQSQTYRDVGNGIVPDLLECRIEQASKLIHGTNNRSTCGGA